jgi:hypothetical protein
VTAMTEDTCTDCGKLRLITLKFRVVMDGRLIDVKLCRGCMRKRAQAMKKTQ